jgi:hypothetical protein
MKALSFIKYAFLTIGLVLITAALYFYQKQRAFQERALTAQGTVIELLESTSDNSIVYKPLVLFKTKEGKEVKFTTSFSTSPPSYSVGESVEVLYDSAEPNSASINGFTSLWLGPLICGVLGMIFFLIGFFIILFDKVKQREIRYLRENGKRISTKFAHVKFNNGLAVNGRNPFLIYSQWLDTNTNELYVFKSDNIWFDPTDFIGTEPIKVMIDPKNPKKYYMDISFLPAMKN